MTLCTVSRREPVRKVTDRHRGADGRAHHEGVAPSRLLALALLLLGTASCAGEPEEVPLPDGVVLHVDQSRADRQGREVFVRVVNPTPEPIRITALTLRSPRLPSVEWTGDETVTAGYERDLGMELPPARCGEPFSAQVRLTYRLGDGDVVESGGTADDRYGAITRFMDRDCARRTLEEAALLEVGPPSVEGDGADAALTLPVTLTPTGERDDVRFGGFDPTVLFRQTDGSPHDVDEPLSAGSGPLRTVMRVRPARCDPHALAEDKVGTLFGVRVLADELPPGTTFDLPLEPDTRSAFFAYFREACGLPG